MAEVKIYRYFVIFLTLVLLIGSLLVDSVLKLLFVSFAALLFVFFYLSIFIKSVEKTCMFKRVNVNKLTEGDWVAEKILINKKLVYTPNNTGISKKDIENLKKNSDKISDVLVKEGIPFVPSFFIAILISLIFGNIIFFVI